MIIQKYKVWMKIHFVCIYHFIRDIISCIGCRLLNIRKCHCTVGEFGPRPYLNSFEGQKRVR